MLALVALVAAVTLGPPFGTAEATAVDDTDGLVVEVSVRVSGSFEAVIVRPFSSFEELPPTALVDRGDGEWAGLVALPTAEDWSVAFDAIERDGTANRSDTTSLTAMGVDPVVVEDPPTGPVPSGGVDAATWWLVAGATLALVALGFLAWWTFGDPAGGDGEDGAPADGDTA